MASRRKSREFALQMLYQAEASGTPMDEVCAQFWSDRSAPAGVREFAEGLARGATDAAAGLDAELAGLLDNWRMDRLAIVDRNILRLAVFEFLHHPETPRVVVIDEAIEIAKRYGGEESGHFVNGVLDALRRRLEAAEQGEGAAALAAPAREDPGEA